MNLRILKKLSARAAPLLARLGDAREQFLAELDDNYHGTAAIERKHWERGNCHPSYKGGDGEIVWTTREGRRKVARPPFHPWPGTVMVGAVTGYYEPEWDEETAWDALREIVCWSFVDWVDCELVSTRDCRNPSQIFAAALDLIAERERKPVGH